MPRVFYNSWAFLSPGCGFVSWEFEILHEVRQKVCGDLSRQHVLNFLQKYIACCTGSRQNGDERNQWNRRFWNRIPGLKISIFCVWPNFGAEWNVRLQNTLMLWNTKICRVFTNSLISDLRTEMSNQLAVKPLLKLSVTNVFADQIYKFSRILTKVMLLCKDFFKTFNGFTGRKWLSYIYT